MLNLSPLELKVFAYIGIGESIICLFFLIYVIHLIIGDLVDNAMERKAQADLERNRDAAYNRALDKWRNS